MPSAHILRRSPIKRSARVQQLEGLFELPPSEHSELTWDVTLPLDEKAWSVGLIVGPSGSGKSTIANELWPEQIIRDYDWPKDRSIIDAFPQDAGIKDITALLSSVGFSSPPSWLRPFDALSNGEQFRVTIARALSEQTQLAVIDEFTSVIDRQVAQIGSAAVAKTVRRRKQQLIAVTCHYDVERWLQPDWTYEPHINEFRWRSVQSRPSIQLEIRRVDPSAWRLFHQHHYLDTNLHRAARCFVAFIDKSPAAFASVLSFPHPTRSGWREHRTVCLPDYQGVGIGNALSETIAALHRSTGKPYFSSTGNPAMIHHRARSPLWRMIRKPSRVQPNRGTLRGLNDTAALRRITASFEYVGPPKFRDQLDALLRSGDSMIPKHAPFQSE